jgi:nitrate reductase beta subunit
MRDFKNAGATVIHRCRRVARPYAGGEYVWDGSRDGWGMPEQHEDDEEEVGNWECERDAHIRVGDKPRENAHLSSFLW